MKYYCKQCGKYLGSMDLTKNQMNFLKIRQIERIDNYLVITCKCRGITKIKIKEG